MPKLRFVLRYEGQGPTPEADVARLRAMPDAVIVDSSPRTLLVEAQPELLRNVVDTLPGWLMVEDRRYAVPDARRKVERPPA